jgi:mannosylglycoprotein endo-beta-mannosidase
LNLLAKEGVTWRLKSRAVWLAKGDSNTKFFHKYANFRKNLNAIWEVDNHDGEMEKNFGGKVIASRSYFIMLFREPPRCPIEEMLSMLRLFLKVFTEEVNLALEEKVTESKLQFTLLSMKKGKIHGFDGFTVVLYTGFYDLIKDYLLKVAQESKRSKKSLGAMNSMFLSIIPKKEATTFEDYRPISCCNVVY